MRNGGGRFARRVAAGVMLAALGVGSASAADPSLAQVSPGRGGTSRMLLDPGASVPGLTAGDVKILVGNGGANATMVTPFGVGAVYTAIAFDASGSFRTHLPAAVSAAKAFAHGLPPQGRTGVFTFGAQLTDLGEASGGGVDALLDRAEGAKAEKVTRLKGLVSEVAERVAQRQPGAGLRQVVVFTDAGEESAVYRLDDVVADARRRGVRIHVVDFSSAGARQAATRLDEMKALAERTGGVHLDGTAADLGAALGDVARAPERLVWVDVAFCGVSAATPFVDDTVQVEVKGATTPKVPFNQEVVGAAVAACPASTAAAKPPVTAPPPDPTATATPGATPASAAPAGGIPWWAVALLAAVGLGLLAALGLGAVVVGRRKAAPARPAASPPPAVPSPPAATLPKEDIAEPPPPPDPIDPFATLPPETQLLVEKAEGATLPPYFRLTKKETVFGADASADVVIDVASVSSRHAVFELFPNGTVWVTDVGSRNGTIVDGRTLAKDERVRLAPGTVVALSQRVHLRLRQPSLEAQKPAARPAASSPPAGTIPAGSPASPAPSAPPPAAPPDPAASGADGARPRKVAKTVLEDAGARPTPPPAATAPPAPSPTPASPGAPAPRKVAKTLYSPPED